SIPIATTVAASPMSTIRRSPFFLAMGSRRVAGASAAAAPAPERVIADTANDLPHDWQNVESAGRVAPQKRQNIRGLRWPERPAIIHIYILLMGLFGSSLHEKIRTSVTLERFRLWARHSMGRSVPFFFSLGLGHILPVFSRS